MISEKKAEEVRAMRASGMTWVDIGRHYHCTETTVRYWAMTEEERRICNKKGANSKPKPEPPPEVPPLPKWTWSRDIVPGTPPIERSALYERASEQERQQLLAECR